MALIISDLGFSLETFNSTQSANGDRGFSFAVNATNATLPLSFTSEQIESAINSPGASAWALTDNSGNLLNGMNIASITRSSSGKYDYVFSTPMSSADYSLAGSVTDASGTTTNGYVTFSKLTSTGFQATTKDNTGATTNRPHSLQVFASNVTLPSTFTVAQFNDLVARVTALENA